jgi:hypothetical protein
MTAVTTGAATATKQAGGTATATEAPQETAEPAEDSGDRLAGPCSLVTPAEISEIAGEEYGEGELDRDDCTYDSPTGRTVSVTLEDHSGQAGSSFQDTLDIFDATEIDGVGERALWIDQFGELNVPSTDRS